MYVIDYTLQGDSPPLLLTWWCHHKEDWQTSVCTPMVQTLRVSKGVACPHWGWGFHYRASRMHQYHTCEHTHVRGWAFQCHTCSKQACAHACLHAHMWDALQWNHQMWTHFNGSLFIVKLFSFTCQGMIIEHYWCFLPISFVVIDCRTELCSFKCVHAYLR